MRYAVQRGEIPFNPFIGFAPTLPPAPAPAPKYLTEGELKELAKETFECKKHEKARDIFLFLCYTGLLHADYKQLKSTQIHEYKGRIWLEGQRKKGETNDYGCFSMPLHKIVLEIIQKYDGIENLPQVNSSKINKYMRESIDQTKYKNRLTTKLGRSTFAHQALNIWGIALESVSAMLGHESTKTTLKYYAKVHKNKIDRDTEGKM